MKNEILMSYTLSKELLLLLGVEKSEITEYRFGLIFFERNDRKLLIKIDSSYYDSKRADCIDLTMYDTSINRAIGYGLQLFHIKNITCDKDFKKFKKMLDVELYEPIEIDCKEEGIDG